MLRGIHQQMSTVHYIANIWTNATSFDPYKLEAEQLGLYEFEWFEGPQILRTIKEILDSDDFEGS